MGYIEEMKLQIEKQIENEDKGSTIRCCGMQLMEIVGSDEKLAQLVCEDFANKRTLQECEKKIEAFAKAHKKSNRGCCPPNRAEEIIREYFGLGSAEQPAKAPTQMPAPKPKVISFADMLAGME